MFKMAKKLYRQAKNPINLIFYIFFAVYFLEGDSSGNTYDSSEIRRFIGGYTKDEYDNSKLFWLDFPLALWSSLMMLLVVSIYWKFPHAVQASHNPAVGLSDSNVNTNHHHDDHHAEYDLTLPLNHDAHGHGLKDFIMDIPAGLPFGLLSYGGTRPFLDMLKMPALYSILNSAAGSVATTFGYMQLHAAHIHADETYFQLLKQLQRPSIKALAVFMSLSVLIGHFFEGSLDGFAFIKTFPDFWTAVQLGISGLFGVFVAGLEANTEMRATLLNLLGKTSRQNPRAISKIILAPAAIFNGLMPSIGFVNFIEFFYKALAKDELVKHLTLAQRILLLCTGILLFGLVCGYTFMQIALPAVDLVMDKAILVKENIGTKIANCGATLSGCWKGLKRLRDVESPGETQALVREKEPSAKYLGLEIGASS